MKVLVALTPAISEVDEKRQSLRVGSLKTVLYMLLLSVLLLIINFIFGEPPFEEVPLFLQPFSGVILLFKPFLDYIRAGLIFVFGYLALNTISGLIYSYMRRVADHPTAAAIRSVTRISGIAILLSLAASVFNVDPTAALTVGSFGGLVVGFATQTILSQVVAGVFLLISRPFTYGDTVTVAKQTGVVKDIRLMHIVLETGDTEILIPSGTVVTQIIQKKRTARGAQTA
ncbi:MAG: mechanosensitive ion channel family protein [Candidatus Bathyarchaeota archaeon]|nr:mechanosensitive ion channel family protein [Candidatus Bathyarchaeota archaeon]